MKKKPTPAQLAALAAGATMDEVMASDDLGGADDTAGSAEAQLALADLNAQVLALSEELATANAGATALEAQLAEASSRIATAEAAVLEANAASAAMTDTIMGRVKNMGIALNAKVPESCDSPVELVKLHAELDSQFKEKFKTGRVTGSSTKSDDKPKQMWTQAQLDSARAIPVY